MTSITYSPTAQQAQECRRLWAVAARADEAHRAADWQATKRLALQLFVATFVLAWFLV